MFANILWLVAKSGQEDQRGGPLNPWGISAVLGL